MEDDKKEKSDCFKKRNPCGSFGGFYFLAIIGTAVYFVGQAHGFWSVVLAILKAIVWPVFLVYKVFTVLGV
ncbi:MAG: hypothetical protein ACOZAG_01250 [Patescibacteria group bacterium]